MMPRRWLLRRALQWRKERDLARREIKALRDHLAATRRQHLALVVRFDKQNKLLEQFTLESVARDFTVRGGFVPWEDE